MLCGSVVMEGCECERETRRVNRAQSAAAVMRVWMMTKLRYQGSNERTEGK